MIFTKLKEIFNKLINKSQLDKNKDKDLFELVSNELTHTNKDSKYYQSIDHILVPGSIDYYINDQNVNINRFFKTVDGYHNFVTILLHWIEKKQDSENLILDLQTMQTMIKYFRDDEGKTINHINKIITPHLHKIDFLAKIPETNMTVKEHIESRLKESVIKNSVLEKTLRFALLNFDLKNKESKPLINDDNLHINNPNEVQKTNSHKKPNKI